MTSSNATTGAIATGPLGRAVLEYTMVMRDIVRRAKEPGFTSAGWAPLAEMVAVEDFERVGTFLEVMKWPEYAEVLTLWATRTHWDYVVRHITEAPGRVHLELAETSSVGDEVQHINSVSVYEYNDAGKLRHLDIYMQQAPNTDAQHKSSWKS